MANIITFTRPLIPSLTVWNRVEPRPRSNSFGANLSASVRDPAWFLARQWQMGEAQGEDAASASFVALSTTTTPIDRWITGTTAHPFTKGPVERQALAEPFPDDDLSLQTAISQLFDDLLDRAMTAAGLSQAVKTALSNAVRARFPMSAPAPDEEPDQFNPIDASTRRFITIITGRAYNGASLFAEAKTTPNAAAVNDAITTDTAQKAVVFTAYTDLITWVGKVWGDLGAADPVPWVAERLEHKFSVGAGPAGASTTLSANPDADGELHWASFDVTAEDPGAANPPPASVTTVHSRPIHLRFRSMPAPRFWDFETADAPLPSVNVQVRDLAKLLSLDFMLVHGEDWFVLPFTMPVGSIARVNSLVVNDVFGGQTLVERADKGAAAQPGPNRFSLFSSAKLNANGVPGDVARLFVSPPSAGAAMQISRPREEVRFARDEMANMAWGIERAVESLIGEPRPGRERDAAVDRVAPVGQPASADTTSPLRYLVESKVPVNYVPLIGVPIAQGSPAIILQKGAIVRATDQATFDTVDAAGKILRPVGRSSAFPYQIFEEEIPRTGLTIQRAVYRTRWIDGSTHVWMARRRRAGEGEAQSGLVFDQAEHVQRSS
jgi:hypothetical protein